MKKYRVQALLDDETYGLTHTEYGDDRGERFELFKNQKDSTIYVNKNVAKIAIDTHKRSRLDQKVKSYLLIKI